MDGLLDAPAFVVVALTGASLLLLIEAALPTFGVAGLSGVALLVAGMVAIDRQGNEWWPLIVSGAAVCLWAVMLVRRDAHPTALLAADGLYLAGAVGYGIAAGNAVAVGFAIGCGLVLAGTYPPLLGATSRLLDQPPQIGLDAFVGRVAVVERAEGRKGTVRLDGSLWSAEADAGDLPPPGTSVLIAGHSGMMLMVKPAAVRP